MAILAFISKFFVVATRPNGVGSELTIFSRISLFCCSWFRLQLITIHCNRRVVRTEHPHTAYFPAHLYTHPCSHAPHGSRCCSACLIKTCSSTCHHVSDCALSLHPLTSSSLSSVSTFCPFLRLLYLV